MARQYERYLMILGFVMLLKRPNFCFASDDMVILDNPCSHTLLPNESGRYMNYIAELDEIPCCGCNAGEYCRNFCSAKDSSDTDCQACPVGTCMPFNAHFQHNCIVPNITKNMCRKDQQYFEGNAAVCPKCICRDGYFEVSSTECESHTPCKIGFGVVEIGTPEKDTVCQKCGRGFESNVVSATEPCRKKRKKTTTQTPRSIQVTTEVKTLEPTTHAKLAPPYGEFIFFRVFTFSTSPILVLLVLGICYIYKKWKKSAKPLVDKDKGDPPTHLPSEIESNDDDSTLETLLQNSDGGNSIADAATGGRTFNNESFDVPKKHGVTIAQVSSSEHTAIVNECAYVSESPAPAEKNAAQPQTTKVLQSIQNAVTEYTAIVIDCSCVNESLEPAEKNATQPILAEVSILQSNQNADTGETSDILNLKDFFNNVATNHSIGSFDHNDVRRFGRNAGLTELQLDEESHDHAMGRQRTASAYFFCVICKLYSTIGTEFTLDFVLGHLRGIELNLFADGLKSYIQNHH